MPNGLLMTNDSTLDLVKSVHKDWGKPGFNQVATTIQDFPFAKRILRKERVKMAGTTGITRNIMTKHSGAAKRTRPFAKDSDNIDDVMGKIEIDWRHSTTNYSYEDREIKMNSSTKLQLFDLLQSRRIDGMISLVELLEEDGWSKPEDSNDDLRPFGFPYWVVPSDGTESAPGHIGGAPAGFPGGAAGLLHDNWKNYAGRYSAVSKADLISKMRTAYRKIRFKNPVDIPDYRRGRGDRYQIYMNEETLKAFEDLGESQNENLGRDLASMDDTITFKRNPLVWIPQLDADATNPIYMINWNHMFTFFLIGEYMNQIGPVRSSVQHRVMTVHIDLTWNMACLNRREQAVFTAA